MNATLYYSNVFRFQGIFSTFFPLRPNDTLHEIEYSREWTLQSCSVEAVVAGDAAALQGRDGRRGVGTTQASTRGTSPKVVCKPFSSATHGVQPCVPATALARPAAHASHKPFVLAPQPVWK